MHHDLCYDVLVLVYIITCVMMSLLYSPVFNSNVLVALYSIPLVIMSVVLYSINMRNNICHIVHHYPCNNRSDITVIVDWA